MVTAKQRANQQRFAAMSRAMAANRRGATGFPSIPFQGSFHRARSYAHSLKEKFHQMSWGIAGLSFLAGYFIPSTLESLGVGQLAYNLNPTYAKINDELYQGALSVTGDTQNPFVNGGMRGWGKLIGIGYTGKKIYDFQKTGQISKGAMNIGIPFSLGLILDGPELAPMANLGNPGGIHGGTWGAGAAAPAMLSSGGVAW